MRNTVVNCIFEKAKQDKNIILLVVDLGYSVVENFFKELPDQVYNVGIAEQNAVGIAAGLAMSGKKVFIYSIVPFVTMRCFEQIRVDVAFQNLDVTLIGVGGGFAYGTLGPTHHAIEDVSVMRSLPNMKIFCPSGPGEAKQLMPQVIDVGGPSYIRLNRGGESDVYECDSLSWNKIKSIKEGEDVMILASGSILESAMGAAKTLSEGGLSVGVASAHTVKPFDTDFVKKIISENKCLVTLEEHTIMGGLGSATAEVIAESGKGIKFKMIGVNDIYPSILGRQDYIRDVCGLSPEKVAKTIKELYDKN